MSATGRPIQFMFCSRMGFSETADLMALFSIRTNLRWRPPPFWIISNGHISTTAYDLLISRGHLCYSTAFLLNKMICIPKSSQIGSAGLTKLTEDSKEIWKLSWMQPQSNKAQWTLQNDTNLTVPSGLLMKGIQNLNSEWWPIKSN